MADIARLTEVIKPEAEALGFDLVRVKMTGQDDERALQIMAEDPATGQLLVQQCMALSRAVSTRMDVIEDAGEALIEGAYNLEVSSPGIDRPLTRPKDFANWSSHDVNVSLADPLGDAYGEEHAKARRLKGVLLGIEGEEITVDDRRIGKVTVPLSNVHSARLVLTDKLIAATRPQDTSGADEIDETPEKETES